ncbi:MAG: dienelactone hydrolase family protein [Pseudomonadota bacterium]
MPDGFKPDGATWATIVVVPTCGGTKASTRDRIKEFLNAGYAVLTVESYKPRMTPNCRAQVVTPPTVFKDTLDALQALQTVPWVNKDRIFQVGYSMGGFAAAWVSSPSNTAQTQSKYRFRASVGHYGSCAYQNSLTALVLPFLRNDIDQPLLMLMADGDLETPSERCFPQLEELKAAGKAVQWHIYPGVTHAWDQAESNGYGFTNGWGKQVIYRYDRNTTEDATRRTLAFLAQFK